MKKLISKEFLKENCDLSQVDDYQIIPYQVFEEFLPSLVSREERGQMTEFEGQDLKKRIDPRSLLSNCKSMLVVVKSYFHESEYSIEHDKVRLSSIARVQDYHTVMHDILLSVVDQLKVDFTFEYYIAVDNQPFLDQAAAYYAGLGFIGHNNLIIHPRLGVQVVISTLLLSIPCEELKIKIIENQCDTCNLCHEACPTKALSLDGFYPKRCLSYLTQSKVIDQQIGFDLITTAYGCDICQNVCPFLKPKGNYNSIELCEELFVDSKELFEMSNRYFKKKFYNTCFSWRSKTIILRNVIFVMSKSKSKFNNDLFLSNINNESSLIRNCLYLALFLNLNHFPDNLDFLINQLNFESDEDNLKFLKKMIDSNETSPQ